MRYFRSALALERKGDLSPVTVADRETESMLADMIRKRYPGHGILGEEHGSVDSHGYWTWVIDPIDGTKSFATGKPLFGTLIALVHDERPVVGIIDAPAMAERWVGAAGRPTVWQGRACRTAATTELGDATLCATSVDMFGDADWQHFESLSRRVRFRNFGGDCYAYGLLASGYVDIVMEADLKPYDYLALVPVIAGAGGIVSDWRGRPLTLHSDGRVIACANAALHRAALDSIGAVAPAA
jgi:histidinol phosphatase-like enzyme (inositol monophosphatase family)